EHGGPGAKVEAVHLIDQAAGVIRPLHQPREFAQSIAAMAAMARDAAGFRLAFQDDDVPDAGGFQAAGAREAGGAAADDDDFGGCGFQRAHDAAVLSMSRVTSAPQ